MPVAVTAVPVLTTAVRVAVAATTVRVAVPAPATAVRVAVPVPATAVPVSAAVLLPRGRAEHMRDPLRDHPPGVRVHLRQRRVHPGPRLRFRDRPGVLQTVDPDLAEQHRRRQGRPSVLVGVPAADRGRP
ncbi:hypothetical protein [Actinacidiphila yeochonensis]|uniref:hypothetical protein n=1 Tax=Actinacidiphila yeochonensis TaxID=89050 RepID=UPI0012FEA7CB|nr:hypothetical protein [Actinacidiphila yeochonensis]